MERKLTISMAVFNSHLDITRGYEGNISSHPQNTITVKLPEGSMVSFHSYVNVYQRVSSSLHPQNTFKKLKSGHRNSEFSH